MKKLIAAILRGSMLAGCALLLAGCAPLLSGLLSAGANATLPPPAQVANQTILDERVAIGIEALYTGFARAGALAFRTGAVTPSPNPAVQRDDFCPRILRREIEASDTGMSLMAIECRLRSARDAARAAYDAGNAQSYQAAFSSAMLAYTEGMALIGR